MSQPMTGIKLKTMVSSTNHQYSGRAARPLKSMYFCRQILIESVKLTSHVPHLRFAGNTLKASHSRSANGAEPRFRLQPHTALGAELPPCAIWLRQGIRYSRVVG